MLLKNFLACYAIIIISFANAYAAEGDNSTCHINSLKVDTVYYNFNNQFEKTIEIYNACIKEYPDKEFLYNNRANTFKLMKEYDKALIDYNKAIEINPLYITSYNGKISLYIIQHKFQEALKVSNELIKINPKLSAAYLQKGIVYSIIEDYDNALKNFNTAIKYKENSALGYYYRAKINTKKSAYKNALNDYKKCLKYIDSEAEYNTFIVNFSLGDVYRGIALSYIGLNDYKNALENLNIAAKNYEEEGRVQEAEMLRTIFELNK